MITAYDFARDMENKGITFGVSAKDTAAALRTLADKIESGLVVMQGGKVLSVSTVDDYPRTVLRLQFHEKRVAELRGAGHEFPLDAQLVPER